MQMKQQGFPESQIIQSLREQGISPREINEALSQSKIKSEIATRQEPIVETEYPVQTNQNMQPSIMPSESQTEPSEQDYQYQPYPSQYPQTYPQQYSEYQEPYDYYQPSDIETINEVAEQIVEEKTSELKKQISSLAKLKQEILPEIEKVNKRVEKIENTIHELQMAILRKIGEYGENIENISGELRATQDSFSKMINPVLDKRREAEEPAEGEGGWGGHEPQQAQEKKPRHRKKPSANFEHYLR